MTLAKKKLNCNTYKKKLDKEICSKSINFQPSIKPGRRDPPAEFRELIFPSRNSAKCKYTKDSKSFDYMLNQVFLLAESAKKIVFQ